MVQNEIIQEIKKREGMSAKDISEFLDCSKPHGVIIFGKLSKLDFLSVIHQKREIKGRLYLIKCLIYKNN